MKKYYKKLMIDFIILYAVIYTIYSLRLVDFSLIREPFMFSLIYAISITVVLAIGLFSKIRKDKR